MIYNIKCLLLLSGVALYSFGSFAQAQMNPSHSALVNIDIDRYSELIFAIDTFYQSIGAYKTVEPDLLSRIERRRTFFITYRLQSDDLWPFSSVRDWSGPGLVDVRLHEDLIPKAMRISVVCNVIEIVDRYGGQLVDLRTGKAVSRCDGKIS